MIGKNGGAGFGGMGGSLGGFTGGGMLNAMFNGTGGGGANRSPWALPPAPKSQKAIGHGGNGGGGNKKNKGGVGGIGQHAPVANAKLVRRMADAGRVEEAIQGMYELVRMGQIESQTFGMVGAAAVKAGSVRALVGVVNAARDALRGRPVLQLAILHSILTSVTINCVAEDEHVSELVEGLADVTEFTEGDNYRNYFKRIATGLLNEYVDEARAALERSRKVSVDALVRMGNCHADITCQSGQKSGEIKCLIPMGSGGGENVRGISAGDLVGISPYSPGTSSEQVIEAEVALVLSREIVVKVSEKADQDKLLASASQCQYLIFCTSNASKLSTSAPQAVTASNPPFFQLYYTHATEWPNSNGFSRRQDDVGEWTKCRTKSHSFGS